MIEESAITVTVAIEAGPLGASILAAVDVASKVLEADVQAIGLDVEVEGRIGAWIFKDGLLTFECDGGATLGPVTVFVGVGIRRLLVLRVLPTGIPGSIRR